MKVTRKFNLAGAPKESFEETIQLIDQDMESLFRAVNSVTFRDVDNGIIPGNIDGRYLIYTTNGTADTDDTVNHKLERVPVGLIQIEAPILAGASPNAGKVYFGSVVPTALTVTLRCTTTSKRAVILLF